MSYLIVTDAHYGWWKSKVPNIEDVINKAESCGYNIKKIITLGDMFDFWRRTPQELIREQIHNIDRLSEKDCINIVGNHDYFLIEGIIPKYKCKRDAKISGYTFIHGYQPEVLSDLSLFESLYGYEDFANKFCYSTTWIGRVSSAAYGTFKGILSSGRKQNKDNKAHIVNFASLLYGKTIMGHLHEEIKVRDAISLKPLCEGYYYILDKNKLYRYNKYNSDNRTIPIDD